MQIINPATEEIIGEVAEDTEAEVWEKYRLAKAGQPLAEVGRSRDPRHSLGPGCTIQRPISADPRSHIANGGIDWTASSWSSVTNRSMS